MKINKLLSTAVMLLIGVTAHSQVEVVGVGTTRKGGSDAPMPLPESTKSYTRLAPGKYEGVYEYSVNTSGKDGNPVTDHYTTILQISDDCAKFGDYAAYLTDSLAASGADGDAITEAQMREYRTEFYFVPEILLNNPDGQTTVKDVSGITTAIYTEPFAGMEWSLTDETDSISGYLCAKATSRYAGRDWEAWYTDEIPSPFGPWKLSGLPGLIIKANDSEGIHSFTLISFRPTDIPVMKTNDSRAIKVDRNKFIAQRNKFANTPMGSIDPASITEISVRKDIGGDFGAVWVNGVQVRMPANKLIPLELE